MSFNYLDLSVLAYANNSTLWHYKTKDKSIETDGYFSGSQVDLLRVNDLLICNINTDETPVLKFYVVVGNENNNVTVKPIN